VTIAVYPASFDPVTNGHLDIAVRASQLFERVIMAVFDRPAKNLRFSTEQRIELLREATREIPRITVDTYKVLTVEYMHSVGARVMVRGLRAASDFEHEFQMAQINQTLAPDIECVMFMANRRHTFISSSTVKEIASLGGDVSELVPPHVERALKRAYGY
jgi:pantetheine-phosphate adenylyltransferase